MKKLTQRQTIIGKKNLRIFRDSKKTSFKNTSTLDWKLFFKWELLQVIKNK